MFNLVKLSALVALLALARPSWAVTVINCQPCTGSSTNVSCPKPTGLALGQLLLAFPKQSGNATISPPAGWTIPPGASTGICGGAGSPHFIYIAWKQATATEVTGGPFVFTWTGGFGKGGTICAYDNVGYAGGMPFDPTNSFACNQNSASTTITWASMTTLLDKTRATYVASSSGDVSGSTVTGPAGTSTDASVATDSGTDNIWVGGIVKTPAGLINSVNGSQSVSLTYDAVILGVQNGPAAAGGQIWPFP